MLRSEVLPAPFGPIIDISSPWRRDSDTLSTARTPPKCFDTSEMASCVSLAVPLTPFKLSDTRPPAFPHPLYQLMPCLYGRHTANACERMQSPSEPPHALLNRSHRILKPELGVHN